MVLLSSTASGLAVQRSLERHLCQKAFPLCMSGRLTLFQPHPQRHLLSCEKSVKCLMNLKSLDGFLRPSLRREESREGVFVEEVR